MEFFRSNKILTTLKLLGIFVLVFMIGCRKAKNEDKPEKPVKVEVAFPLEKEVVLTESYPGNLVALRQVDIMARVDGIIKKAFQDQAVSEMELLQGISNLEQATAQIDNYKAALSNAQTMLGYCVQ